ncbi:MAG: response regulator [Candidatus Delongbacteria bacterium]
MRRVFLVSRDPAVLRQAGDLIMTGHLVESSLGGAETVARLREQPVDLLLLDPDPADMSTAELLRQLEEAGCLPPWAVLCPGGDERLAAAWVRRGALDVLPRTGHWMHTLPDDVERLLTLGDSQQQLQAGRRQRREAQLQRDLMLDGVAGLLLLVDAEGAVAGCNEAARRCGLQPGRLLPGPEAGVGDWRPPATLLRTGLTVRREQELNGLLYEAHWTLQGRLAVCLALEKGPHQREEQRRRRLENRRLLAQKLDSLNELASHLAHDISNQLLVIMGYSDMLRERLAEDASASQWTQSIRKAAEGVSQHIRRLISFTRGRGGQFSALDFHALVGQVAERLRPEHPLVHFRLRLEARTYRIWGDAGRLEDALHNICLNACEAMPRGGTMQLITSNLIPEGSTRDRTGLPPTHLQLLVRDTGAGMSEEVLERIFDPFFTTRKKEGGAGLGLSSAWSCIRGHRGSIDAESRPGSGSQIRILLPLSHGETHAESGAEGLGGHVLVVDDDEVVRGVVQSILRSLGCQVTSFSGAPEALAWVDAQSPHLDLALLDLRMPRMNGWELLQELRRRDPRLRALIMTAWADDLVSGQVDPAVVLGVLRKPFELEELHTHVLGALAAIQAERLGDEGGG